MAISTQAAVNAAWGETVTYSHVGTGSYKFVAGRYEGGEAEGVSSYGAYSIRSETFTFDTTVLGTHRPRLRDTITNCGVTRVVTEVTGSAWLKFWKVTTAYPSLADALDQTGTVKRSAAVPDSLGLRNPTFSTLSTIACRLQPDTRERDYDAAGRVVTRSRWVLVCGAAITFNAGDTVTVGDVIYEVVKQSEIESLGVLTFAECERID